MSWSSRVDEEDVSGVLVSAAITIQFSVEWSDETFHPVFAEVFFLAACTVTRLSKEALWKMCSRKKASRDNIPQLRMLCSELKRDNAAMKKVLSYFLFSTVARDDPLSKHILSLKRRQECDARRTSSNETNETETNSSGCPSRMGSCRWDRSQRGSTTDPPKGTDPNRQSSSPDGDAYGDIQETQQKSYGYSLFWPLAVMVVVMRMTMSRRGNSWTFSLLHCDSMAQWETPPASTLCRPSRQKLFVPDHHRSSDICRPHARIVLQFRIK